MTRSGDVQSPSAKLSATPREPPKQALRKKALSETRIWAKMPSLEEFPNISESDGVSIRRVPSVIFRSCDKKAFSKKPFLEDDSIGKSDVCSVACLLMRSNVLGV